MIFPAGAVRHIGGCRGRDGEDLSRRICLTLEVTMADRPGRPQPPPFSWNVGKVMHILKSNPVLRELEHVQIDGPGTAYLFFYDKQDHRGLEQDAMDAIQTHVEEAFLESISCSAHFNISLLPLMEAWQQSITASIMHQLEWHGSLTPLANWWGVHLSRMEEPLGWGRGPRQDLPPILGQHDCAEGHQRPSALWWRRFAPFLPRQGSTRL